MSAKEIIDQIKSLPPQEQAQVIEFVTELKAKPDVKYASDEAFRAAADEVFSKHHELLRKLASS